MVLGFSGYLQPKEPRNHTLFGSEMSWEIVMSQNLTSEICICIDGDQTGQTIVWLSVIDIERQHCTQTIILQLLMSLRCWKQDAKKLTYKETDIFYTIYTF